MYTEKPELTEKVDNHRYENSYLRLWLKGLFNKVMQRKPGYGLSHADGDPLVTTGYLGKCVFTHQLVAKGKYRFA